MFVSLHVRALTIGEAPAPTSSLDLCLLNSKRRFEEVTWSPNRASKPACVLSSKPPPTHQSPVQGDTEPDSCQSASANVREACHLHSQANATHSGLRALAPLSTPASAVVIQSRHNDIASTLQGSWNCTVWQPLLKAEKMRKMLGIFSLSLRPKSQINEKLWKVFDT